MPWLCRPRVVIFLLSGYAWVWAALTQFSLFSVNKCAIVSSGPVFVTTVITCVDFVQRECENMSHPRSNNASSLWQYANQFNTCLFLLMCCQWSAHYSPVSTSSSEHSIGVWQTAQWCLRGHVKCTVKSTFLLHVLLLNYNVPLAFLCSAQPIRRWAARFMSLNTGQQQKLVCLCVNYRSERKNNYSFGSCNFVNLT